MTKVFRCQTCGYIYRDNEPPHECPFCHSPQSVFEEIPVQKINFDFFKDAWTRQVKWMNASKYQDEIQLNPDEKILKMLADGEGKNLLDEKKGQAYCPCRVLSGNKWGDRKIVCPCYFYMGEIEIDGQCHCLLYLKKQQSGG